MEDEKEKGIILQQRKDLEDQGISFYSDPNEKAGSKYTRRSCCTKRYMSWFVALIAICLFIFYVSNKDDNKKFFSSGNIKIEADLSYTEGIDGDVNIDLKISSSDGEVIFKEKTIIEVIFSSDKYEIVNVPIVFYQDVMVTKNKRVPYTFHIKKTDFMKSTKMRIRIASFNFDDSITLK